MELICFDVTENGIAASSPAPVEGWRRSCKVRNILRKGSQYGLVYNGEENYYTFPGGSAEPGETPIQAVIRETAEEVGCTVQNLVLTGQVREFRAQTGVLQTTFYFTSQLKEPGAPALTPEEARLHTTFVWVDEARCGELLNRQAGEEEQRYFRKFSGMRDREMFRRYLPLTRAYKSTTI